MNEGMIILDKIPDSCFDCIGRDKLLGRCQIHPRHMGCNYVDRPDWCPIVPAPNKVQCYGIDDLFDEGYNRAIKNIFGDEDD